MCGIAFSYQPQQSAEARQAALALALQRLSHRGPDDIGRWDEHPCAIGHRRLAIIDLAASRQPMHDADNRFVLTYNGEIYNFKELRAELSGRWTFRTQGDTEVVLAGLALFGPAFLPKMEGMWALALWDRQRRSLLLARDRMGKKPLYYQQWQQGMICASELPALSALAPRWHESLDSTADYLRYGYYLPGTTAYENVREVLPGHSLQWQPGTQPIETAYWSLTVGGFAGSRADARAQLRERFTHAIRRRLVADVEVGAFLSGGIDSSLIVGLLARDLKVKPKTFTIGFSDPSYDERRYARLAATTFGSDHYERELRDWDADLLQRLIFDHVGQPFADSSLLPTAFVSQIAAEQVKVALSGDGGDELFSGYQRYQARVLLRWYTRLPTTLRTNIEKLLKKMPEPTAHHSRSVLKKAHLFYDVMQRRDAETPYVAPVYYNKTAFNALAPDLAQRGHTAPALPAEARIDEIETMMAADALVYLPQDILVKVDRATMAYSLEARAPFLDSSVVALAFSLPRPWHRRGFSGKRLLRETFADVLPHTLWRRRKQGFGVPLHEWFRGHLGNKLRELMSTSSPLDSEYVRCLLDEHQCRRRDHGYRLWEIYIYLLWRQGKWQQS